MVDVQVSSLVISWLLAAFVGYVVGRRMKPMEVPVRPSEVEKE